MGFVQTLTEGGQTWAHRVRMLKQVIKLAFGVSLCVGLAFFTIAMWKVPKTTYQGLWYYTKAQVLQHVASEIEVNGDFWAYAARERYSTISHRVQVKRAIAVTHAYANQFQEIFFLNLLSAFKIMTATTFITLLFFFFRGFIKKGKHHISGNRITNPTLLRIKLFFTRKKSKVNIGPLPLIKNSETQHILITGGTGSGKTNCLMHLLEGIRSRKQKAIIVDTTGAFVNRFYREGKDYILSPFSEESQEWHPWIECLDVFDYDSIAESFIPSSYNEYENYWRQSAQSVFSSLLQKLGDTHKTSELSNWMLYKPLEELSELLQGTKASAHMSMKSEKTSGSIRSVASSFLNCLDYLKDTKNSFSIREWVKSEDCDSWLFLHCTTGQRSAATPLMTTWISMGIKSLMNLNPDRKRRLWFILDEAASLNKVKDLEVIITEGRKFGGCTVLALQSPSQLEAIYGKNTTNIITGNCYTKIVFSEQDPEVAKRVSRCFGEREIWEYQEGLTYGAHEVRDGVSLSSQQKNIPVISASDIQSLKRNVSYVKLPEGYPIIKIKFPIA